MDKYTATEVAYKNGFEDGKKYAAEDILSEIDKLSREGGVIWTNYAHALLQELKKRYEVK